MWDALYERWCSECHGILQRIWKKLVTFWKLKKLRRQTLLAKRCLCSIWSSSWRSNSIHSVSVCIFVQAQLKAETDWRTLGSWFRLCLSDLVGFCSPTCFCKIYWDILYPRSARFGLNSSEFIKQRVYRQKCACLISFFRINWKKHRNFSCRWWLSFNEGNQMF